MSMSILGIGTVSASGSGIESLRRYLMGECQPAIVPYTVYTDTGEKSIQVYKANVTELERFIPKRKLRRMDHFTQMALLASFQAIEDSGIEVQGSERVGIIFGSGYGLLRTTFNFLDSIIEDGDECASPIKFATSVHNSLASNVSITLGIKGASLTISTFHHSTAGIFQTAMNWLDSKMVDHVLVGMGDEYCDAMGYVLKRAECQHEENTYIPGELFTCILLGRESEQQSGYGKIKEVHLSKKIDQVEPELFNKLDAVIIAENGESCVANLYETVIPFGKTIITYSSLYGCSTVGNGIDTAVAALSLRDKKLYAPPSIPPGINPDMISAGKPLKENSMIGCLECADSRMNLIIVANQ